MDMHQSIDKALNLLCKDLDLELAEIEHRDGHGTEYLHETLEAIKDIIAIHHYAGWPVHGAKETHAEVSSHTAKPYSKGSSAYTGGHRP